MSETIEFTEEAIKKYLDKCIASWREKRDIEVKQRQGQNSPFPNMQSTSELIASCYVDAFQSVRTSLFGETL